MIKNSNKDIDLRFFVLILIISATEVFDNQKPVYGILFLFSVVIIFSEIVIMIYRKIINRKNAVIKDVTDASDRFLK